MAAYDLFIGGTIVILVVVISLAILTQQRLDADPNGVRIGTQQVLSTRELYLNVVITQAVVAGSIVALVWVTEIPWASLGVGILDGNTSWAIAVGTVVGVGLFILNETSLRVLDRLGIPYSEELRAVLAPESAAGWVVLLVLVLPVIAVAEELLFRAAIIGAVAAGFEVSVWLLAVLSSIAFAVGHGMQGQGGILVTGVLGLVLAATFVLTGSLLVVVVAHYVVNALEFLAHEGPGRGVMSKMRSDR